MGGFIYTNCQSLSVGLVLPADNLKENFDGDPNLLMEWFLQLPSLRPWLEGANAGPFGAKIIRGGGIKEVPTLIDNGLAIGGAASGIGIDFPYPNFTGPATAMGLLIAQAARAIRQEGGDFTRERWTNITSSRCNRHTIGGMSSSFETGLDTSRKRRPFLGARLMWPSAAPTSGRGQVGV